MIIIPVSYYFVIVFAFYTFWDDLLNRAKYASAQFQYKAAMTLLAIC